MKMSGTEQVEQFLSKLEHPLKPEIEAVRRIVLAADERLTEQIKWNAPSFCVNGEDRITMNFRGKGGLLLVFHRGAKASRDSFEFRDDTGLLEWAAADRAIVKLADRDDVEAKKERLAQAVAKWVTATI
ncbi:DUF1801 domain-containing protein [Cohnella cellulosilytica]|uniref:DUF1801 domain-containing protein n=1 Tax=Cohnella cellulosilytica TaxID=986710 RepID=A0ABW2FC18_9BACL